jgi:hypothetical protein
MPLCPSSHKSAAVAVNISACKKHVCRHHRLRHVTSHQACLWHSSRVWHETPMLILTQHHPRSSTRNTVKGYDTGYRT